MTRSIAEAPPRRRRWLHLSIYSLAIGMSYAHYDATVTGADPRLLTGPNAELMSAMAAPIPDLSLLADLGGIADGVPQDAAYDDAFADEGFEEGGFVDHGPVEEAAGFAGATFTNASLHDEVLEADELLEEEFVGEGFEETGFEDEEFVDDGFEEGGFDEDGFEEGGFDDDFESEGFVDDESEGFEDDRDDGSASVLTRTASLPSVAPPAARPQPRRSNRQSDVLEGRFALLMNLLLLEKGYAQLSKTPSYTATFFKQERLGDELGEGQVIQVKLRHAPFSVYMHWLVGDKGREVLYIDGENDGDMVAHPGGWKGRMLPAINLNPRGSIAMAESRHPVTNIGLLELARHGIEICKQTLTYESGVSCYLIDNQMFDNRPCYLVVVEHATQKTSPDYRKLVVYIDEKLSVPVAVRNFGWPQGAQRALKGPQLDAATLVENYSYSNIQIEAQLAAADFDRNNKSYKFRR